MNDFSKRNMAANVTPEKYADIVSETMYLQFEKCREDFGIEFSTSKRILDIGCGTGEVTKGILELAHNAEMVMGCDIANEYVDFCKERYAKNDKLQFQTLDASKEWPNASHWRFDTIFSNAVVHRISNHQQLYNRIYNTLNVNGQAILIFNKCFVDVEPTLKKLFKANKWRTYLYEAVVPSPKEWDDLENYRNMIQSIGFEVTNCEAMRINHSYPDSKSAIPNIDYWLPALKFIPDELHREFMYDFIDNLPTKKFNSNEVFLRQDIMFVRVVKRPNFCKVPVATINLKKSEK